MTFTLATFTLQVLAPSKGYLDREKRVLSNLPAMIEAIEEDLTDLLPEGYTAKVEKAL